MIVHRLQFVKQGTHGIAHAVYRYYGLRILGVTFCRRSRRALLSPSMIFILK